MSSSGPSGRTRSSDRAWYVAGVAVAIAVAALVVTVIGIPGSGNENQPVDSSRSARSSVPPTTQTDSTDTSAPAVEPSDQVAYITSDGRILSAIGARTPAEVASGAALGPDGRGALSISPTGDLIAFVRADGALVTVPVEGGDESVLATDASLVDIGEHRSLAWNSTSSQLAYLAVGTPDMVEPRPEVPPALSAPEGVFRTELPVGELGNALKFVDRDGKVVIRLGDPSTRSMVSVTGSPTDDFFVIESVIPGTDQPYTLSMFVAGALEISPTVLSADDPDFSSDGSFIIVVGPDKSGQELIRISTDDLSLSTLASTDKVCAPSVSPDSTRIAYGSGPNCSKLMLISSRGGTPIDITPPGRPGTATFSDGGINWTADAHFLVFVDCRSADGPVTCGGPVSFFDPDRSLLIGGVDATTVATVRRPLLSDLRLDVAMGGPIEYSGSFPVDAAAEADLTELDDKSSSVDVVLADGDRSFELHLKIAQGSKFAAGRMTIVDPDKGVDRSFLVTSTASLIGARVASLSGVWVSSDDLPFISGEFRLAVRRGV